MGSVLSFLGRQLFITPTPADASRYSLRGQVGLVTGSNGGLGFEAAKQLLALGLSKLIIAVRNQQRGDEAAAKLAKLYPHAQIEVSIVDMASYESIKAFADRCAALPRLDFAVLNAGVVKFKFETNKLTGHEDTIQINVISTALLASLLLPVLANKNPNGPGKITIVGSEVAEWAQFKQKSKFPLLPQFDIAKGYDGNERYNVSKLLLEYYVVETAKRVNPDKVILNIVNPGFCYGSDLHREIPGTLGRIFGGFKRAIGRPLELGGRPIVKAAIAEGKASHGQFYSDNAITNLAPMARGANESKYGPQTFQEIMAELSMYHAEEAINSVGFKSFSS